MTHSPLANNGILDRSPPNRGKQRSLLRFLVPLILGPLLLGPLGGCTFLPSEFNLSPFYRQRLDENGEILELDVAWPIVHIERDPHDGDIDFRLRPFYRRLDVSEDENVIPGYAAVEHNFLPPLGLHRSDGQQTRNRFFPFWSYVDRIGQDGLRETDWYVLFPFIWGGTREDDTEDYFGIFPFYADLPQFLTFDRLWFVMWPLYTQTKKSGNTGHHIFMPFGGFGTRDSDGEVLWFRALPLISRTDHTERTHTSLFWPFLGWGTENKSSPDPLHRWLLWPLVGRAISETGRSFGWTFLNPLFQYFEIEGRRKKIDILWPFFRFEEDLAESNPLYQWWFFPLVARTRTDEQYAWQFLWPLIWWREYDDPEGVQKQRWFLPVYWTVDRELDNGGSDYFDHLWPLWHRDVFTRPDGSQVGDWSVLSLFPYRDSTALGIVHAYDWFWTLARRQWDRDDDRFHLFAHLYTERTRGDRVQLSVPFLFNYESDGTEKVLRLFQFLPIRWGGDDSDD